MSKPATTKTTTTAATASRRAKASSTTATSPHSFSTKATIFAADAIIRSLYGSLRLDFHGRDIIEAKHRKGEGYILAIWHCNVLLSPIIHRGMGVMVMVSMSRDGDVIAGVVERLGNLAVRGSSSKEGRKALKDIIHHLRGGGSAAITPDGPLGPYMKLKSGVIAMAQRAQVPIIPMHYEADRRWQLSSWDRHTVPKPFARLVVRYGEPITIPAELSGEDFNRRVVEAEREILSNVRLCRGLLAP